MNDQNKWAFAYHRIKVAEDNAKNGKPGACSCSDCKEVMASLGMDYRGKDLPQVSA
jgi:hypothetical protein